MPDNLKLPFGPIDKFSEEIQLFPPVDEEVILEDIRFASVCAFDSKFWFGKITIHYYPRRGVLEIGQVRRIVDFFTHRKQIQEDLTAQLLQFLLEVLDPKWLVVTVKARHYPYQIRLVTIADSRD